MSMLPTPPDCGVPCGTCEALAHQVARLKERNAYLESIDRSTREALAVQTSAAEARLARAELAERRLAWLCSDIVSKPITTAELDAAMEGNT